VEVTEYRCVQCGDLTKFANKGRVPPCRNCGTILYAKLRKVGYKRVRAD